MAGHCANRTQPSPNQAGAGNQTRSRIDLVHTIILSLGCAPHWQCRPLPAFPDRHRNRPVSRTPRGSDQGSTLRSAADGRRSAARRVVPIPCVRYHEHRHRRCGASYRPVPSCNCIPYRRGADGFGFPHVKVAGTERNASQHFWINGHDGSLKVWKTCTGAAITADLNDTVSSTVIFGFGRLRRTLPQPSGPPCPEDRNAITPRLARWPHRKTQGAPAYPQPPHIYHQLCFEVLLSLN